MFSILKSKNLEKKCVIISLQAFSFAKKETSERRERVTLSDGIFPIYAYCDEDNRRRKEVLAVSLNFLRNSGTKRPFPLQAYPEYFSAVEAMDENAFHTKW